MSKEMAKKVVLSIGHSDSDPGAVNTNLPKEWQEEFENVKDIAFQVLSLEKNLGLDLVLKKRNTYGKLAAEVNEWNPDFAAEVHLNASSNKNVQGFEVLYCGASKSGKKIAMMMAEKMSKIIPIRNRGIKAVPRTGDDARGASYLYKTKMPAVIIECFFLSGVMNTEDLKELRKVSAEAIYESISELVEENMI